MNDPLTQYFLISGIVCFAFGFIQMQFKYPFMMNKEKKKKVLAKLEKKLEEFERKTGLSKESAIYIVYAVELLLGFIILPLSVISKLCTIFTGKDILGRTEDDKWN